MIFRFDGRKSGAITYSPMDSHCSPRKSPPDFNSSQIEEIHVERTA
jgi:hypothetical protein